MFCLILTLSIGSMLSLANGAAKCITSIYLFGETGDLHNAPGAAGEYLYVFKYAQEDSRMQLYNRPSCNDYIKGQGDIWKLDGPPQCATKDNLKNGEIIATNPDRWFASTVMSFGILDDTPGNLVLISHMYQVNHWADLELGDAIPVDVDNIERDNCDIKRQCIQRVHLIVETADEAYAEYDKDKKQILRIGGDTVSLYKHSGVDVQERCKSDLWSFDIEEFGVSDCKKFGDVDDVALIATTGARWTISKVFVTVLLDSGSYALLAGTEDCGSERLEGEGDEYQVPLKNECKGGEIDCEGQRSS